MLLDARMVMGWIAWASAALHFALASTNTVELTFKKQFWHYHTSSFPFFLPLLYKQLQNSDVLGYKISVFTLDASLFSVR